MPGPEAKIERQIRREAKAAGWTARKVKFLDCRGAPDHFFGRNFRGVFIEFKRLRGSAREQQLRRHKELRLDYGMEVHICDSVESARIVLGLGGIQL